MADQEQADRCVRRGAVQALVRTADQSTVAKQASEHHPPAAFAEAWHDDLADLLNLAQPDLPGWGPSRSPTSTSTWPGACTSWPATPGWTRFEHARAAPSRRAQRGHHIPTFELAIVCDGESLGDVTYGRTSGSGC